MALKQYWQGLQPRERWVIGTGAAVLLVGLGYAYLWQPLTQERLRLRESLPRLRAQAAQLAADRDEALRLKGQKLADRGIQGSLRQALEDGATALDLRKQIEHLDVEGDTRVRLVLGNAPFDAWVRWLKQLQSQQGVRVESCTVEPAGQPGLVRVQAVMVRE